MSSGILIDAYPNADQREIRIPDIDSYTKAELDAKLAELGLEGIPLELFIAIAAGETDIAKLLLLTRVDANAISEEGYSPLMMACIFRVWGIIGFLISHGADVNFVSPLGEAPLRYALTDLDAVKALIEAGAEINHVKAEDGSNAFLWGAANGNLEVLRVLLAHGADRSTCYLDGTSALMMAAQKGHSHVVKFLVADGCDINQKSKDGFTALIWAVQEREYEVATLLVDLGADPSINDSLAIEFAKQHSAVELVAYLEKSCP